PKKGSFIIASNHVSYLDPLAIGVFVPRSVHYLAKEELYKNRFFGWYMMNLNTIPVDRKGRSLKGMRKIVELIRKGEVIAVFPEGTRSDGKDFLQPQMGAAYFSLKFKVPILPVYVKGTDKVMPKGASKLRFNHISVYYGRIKRYSFEDWSGDRDEVYKRVSLDIMEEIKKIKEQSETQN
ncbi:MAG: 1-acyl-sn-glycerol-3-phosphate acyltransferase, partial [Candidatus Omnitrophica bacterium]|nr:1-acyl-sn-glycerol-3-phosphate acyltransferase [Candidatus Omnitrophota bacterium]